MIKRIISIFLSVIMMFSCMSAFSLSVQAVTYSQQLKNKGFSDSYISKLSALHEKYPNWEFKAFKTGLNWNDVIEGERSQHSKQVILKISRYNNGYYCNCEKCFVNGKYVYQESSHVSASEAAVKYYIDPRNWLNEQGIFQFESTAYNKAQTVRGVESIISGTWMSDAYITYKNANGKTVTYKDENSEKVKYSTAIMQSAKDSGLSAYYLASKIVKEVGGAKNTAGGASGTYSGYEGIYNYYNIGAYTGAADGLRWASAGSTGHQTNCNANLREKPTTDSKALVVVPKSNDVVYVSSTKKQPDGYVWYKVKVKVRGVSYSGYLRSDLVSKVTPTYGRPWNNPYKSIYYGAQYISKSFADQNTGYLQKFNVNKDSGSLYSHEYMTNVDAASCESATTYEAYKDAGILKGKKVFYIPVFNNMPKNASPLPKESDSVTPQPTQPTQPPTQVTGLKITSITKNSLSYSWNKVQGATKYRLTYTNVETGNSYNRITTANKYSVENLRTATRYSVKVQAYVKGRWKKYSSSVSTKTLPSRVKNLKAEKYTATTITISWSPVKNADGYVVYKYANGVKKKLETITSGSTTSVKLLGLSSGTRYDLCVSAYTVNSSRVGEESTRILSQTKPATVTSVKLTPTNTTVKVSWSVASGVSNGYLVSFARDSAFKDVIATRTVKGAKNTSYVGKNLTAGRSYYVRIRTYRIINGKTYYSNWTKAYKFTCTK